MENVKGEFQENVQGKVEVEIGDAPYPMAFLTRKTLR